MKHRAHSLSVLAIVLGMAALPGRAATSGFILGQGPGKLVDSLIAAGYGNLSVYDALLTIQQNTNPIISGVVTDSFMATLLSCPANSPIFTTKLSAYAGTGVLISTNCTAVATNFQGSGFNGIAGTTTLSTVISGISTPAAVVSSTTSNPICTLDPGASGVCGPPLSCVNLLGILYAPQGTSQSFVLSNEGPGQLIGKLLAAGYGRLTLYQTLVTIGSDSNPPVFDVLLSPAFVQKLTYCPVGSQGGGRCCCRWC